MGLTLALCLAPTPGAAQADTVGALPGAAEVTAAPQATAQDTAPESISPERAAADEAVRTRLQAIFDRVQSLSAVAVEVEAGIVRLSGTIADAEAGRRAEDLAREQDGVLFVENRLQFTTSLEERLQPTWDRLRELVYGTVAKLPLLAVALAIILLAVFLGRVAGRWGGPSFLGARNPLLQTIIARAIQAAVVLAGLLVALDLLEATALVGAVAGTAGLAGLALGFAFKDIVENYLAGLLLAVRQPFAQNDHVLVEGYEGKVVRLTPRETILMTLEGNHVRLPNALVFRSPLTNYTRNPRRRFSFDLSVGPAEDLTAVREIGTRVLRGMESVLQDPPPETHVREVGDSWVTVRFLGWIDQRNSAFERVRSEALRLVKLGLEHHGISLPPPEYLIRMEGMEEEPSGEVGPAPTAFPEVDGGEGDVSVDDSVDRQIAEDREVSGEDDLLSKS